MLTRKQTGPVVAVGLLLLIVAFGAYALRGALGAVTHGPDSAITRGTPAGEQGGEVFEPLWSADIGVIQDLTLMRPDGLSGLQLLALAQRGNEIVRFDPQGRIIDRIEAPTGAFRLTADVRGRLRFFLAASIESHWSWKDLRRVTTANHLSAIDLQGRTLWTYTLTSGPGSVDRSSPFQVALLDGEADAAVAIMVDVGARLVGLDTAGRQIWSMPHDFRAWTQIDWEGTGRPGVLALRPAGHELEVAAFDGARRLTPVATLPSQSPPNGWHVARMNRMAAPTIATLTMASVPDAARRLPEIFTVYAMTGTPIGTATFPWPTRPIVTKPLSMIDTDGDGSQAWIAAGDDGVLYLFSADARSQEVHHTTQHIRRLAIMSMSAPGDWLVLGTERGVQVLRRRASLPSGVD